MMLRNLDGDDGEVSWTRPWRWSNASTAGATNSAVPT